jgi:hypothetical protein
MNGGACVFNEDAVFDIPRFAEWWAKVQALLPSYKNTQPNLG